MSMRSPCQTRIPLCGGGVIAELIGTLNCGGGIHVTNFNPNNRVLQTGQKQTILRIAVAPPDTGAWLTTHLMRFCWRRRWAKRATPSVAVVLLPTRRTGELLKSGTVIRMSGVTI